MANGPLTSRPAAFEIASVKSFAVAVPYACAFRYARTPSRNTSGPTDASNMRRTDAPFSYVMRSNALSMSSKVATGWRIMRADASESAASAVSR